MAVLTDPISDFLTRFKNAARAGNEEFTAPYSKIKADIAEILKQEGYLWKYEVVTGERTELKVSPKFIDGRPVLTDLKRVSKPGRRQYVGSQEIPRVLSGLGISILSTSKGVMSGASAKRQKLGGEILANIW
ncbi:MAG: 30S ribosomal protein S8 [Akkermansiaceae bacterium]|jgi:small subunit ribosomal protein S8|nr:30S ribosomal protein S8 [Akkermansiaceae bacterium]MDP4646248.1 30S ribosomal protein S8 [Akkermansiaceae bacterium]MDP4720270.1 30S ribosomal protein S8 [Akkermansiaceae bacterium]MDP4779911.1 30S ribosomal protein S8 [Akkermansiaceae bacterium]MDP4845878.1 30S ribosomal protein S8 [Akkermansiaceae bacterium]